MQLAKNIFLFNEHPLYPTCACSEWARCNASAGPSALSRPFLTPHASVQSAVEEEERARRHPISASLISLSPLLPPVHPPANAMINITPQSYGIQTDPETDFFLLKASPGEAMVQLSFETFSYATPESRTRN